MRKIKYNIAINPRIREITIISIVDEIVIDANLELACGEATGDRIDID
jgi:hypothetical protein